MINKSELRSEFERIVATKKHTAFVTEHYIASVLPIVDWRLSIDKVGSSFCIVLYAVSKEYVNDDGMECCSRIPMARSYPFRSYKSAYQTLVRL